MLDGGAGVEAAGILETNHLLVSLKGQLRQLLLLPSIQYYVLPPALHTAVKTRVAEQIGRGGWTAKARPCSRPTHCLPTGRC